MAVLAREAGTTPAVLTPVGQPRVADVAARQVEPRPVLLSKAPARVWPDEGTVVIDVVQESPDSQGEDEE